MSLLLIKSMLLANVMKKSKKKKKHKKKPILQDAIQQIHTDKVVGRRKRIRKSKKLDLSMCRICNGEQGILPIFDNLLLPNISEEIHNFTGVTISESDNFSKHMCQNCLDLLNGCITFRNLCQKTDKMLVELSIKKEIAECNYDDKDEQTECNGKNGGGHSDDESYNIPSPEFSDSELWGCATCQKEFYNLKSYNKHLSECSKEACAPKTSEEALGWKSKSFLCDICGKTARSKASLLVHMYKFVADCTQQQQATCRRDYWGIHENVFPFKCEECPYQGRTMDLLKVHKRSHLVDKPFKCSQCPKATTTSSNLAKHMRHVHSTARPFKCSYCDKAFSYQHDMKRHIRDIHLRQGTVECDVCYKKFNTKKILQGHRWKIHKIKGERQGRLPSYLQCQMGEHDNNINNCDNY